MKVWELRLSGQAQSEIAKQVGVSQMTISNDLGFMFEEYQRHYAEKAERAATIDLERIDKLISAYWQPAISGEIPAAEIVLKFLNHRGKIHGYTLPKNVVQQTDSDELAKQILKRLDENSANSVYP